MYSTLGTLIVSSGTQLTQREYKWKDYFPKRYKEKGGIQRERERDLPSSDSPPRWGKRKAGARSPSWVSHSGDSGSSTGLLFPDTNRELDRKLSHETWTGSHMECQPGRPSASDSWMKNQASVKGYKLTDFILLGFPVITGNKLFNFIFLKLFLIQWTFIIITMAII